MELPTMLQGDSLKRLLQGAALGGFAAIAIGFGMGGWVLGGSAAKQVEVGAHKAVVAVLAPICAEKFQLDENAATNLASLKGESSWQRANFIEKGGWAILPGNDKPGPGVASACAALLNDM